jgi:hypothetical protein
VAVRLSSGASGADAIRWIGLARVVVKFDCDKPQRRLADVLKVVEQVLTRTEIEMAGFASFVRDDTCRTVVDMLEAVAGSEGGPEIVQGVPMGAETFARFEVNAPNLDSLVDR